MVRVHTGQVIMSIPTKLKDKEHVIEALCRAKFKFPGRQKSHMSRKWRFTKSNVDEFEKMVALNTIHMAAGSNTSLLLLFSSSVMFESLQPHGLCDPSSAGLPVPHHLPKFAQVHVHCIRDLIQPSHPLIPSSPFALSLSQHQGLFQ